MSRVRPILSAARMRSAEEAAIKAGASVATLMERAGRALAEAALAFAGPMPSLILCGPGNNGGDGYVAARVLAERGMPVRVAASAVPSSAACRSARAAWSGAVEQLGPDTRPAPLLIDALFGTGLKRSVEAAVLGPFLSLSEAARLRIACDLPSGVDADSGVELNPVPNCDLTVTFGALKPAHRLFPAMHRCGRVVLADIGIDADPRWHEIAPPSLPPLAPGGHKYDRGLVLAVAGAMPGAIALAASAAARVGAGYVRVATPSRIAGLPHALVQTDKFAFDDPRIGCLLVGPGLGEGAEQVEDALASRAPKVLDADALRLVGDPQRLRGADAIVTPHGGEFDGLFGASAGGKADRTQDAAERSGAIVVHKGPDTIVAAPDGRLGFAPPAPAWLASAGTGDVLAGIIAALRARGMAPFDAACSGVWLHGRAAEIAGPSMIADDLLAALPQALALSRHG